MAEVIELDTLWEVCFPMEEAGSVEPRDGDTTFHVKLSRTEDAASAAEAAVMHLDNRDELDPNGLSFVVLVQRQDEDEWHRFRVEVNRDPTFAAFREEWV